jgi:16S rRNA processing protein RimM
MKKLIPEPNTLVFIGIVIKLHGKGDEFLVSIENKNFEDFIENEPVYLEIEGKPVPFFLEDWFFKGTNSLIIKFDEKYSESITNQILKSKLFVRKSEKDETNNDDDFSQLFGYEVHDKVHGNIGVVEGVEEISYNPLLIVKNGKIEILIPINKAIIKKVNHKNKVIQIEAPEGLIELYITKE